MLATTGVVAKQANTIPRTWGMSNNSKDEQRP
jgi:hypothetical protein